MNLYQLVKKFHDWFRVPAPAIPAVPPDDIVRLRLRMQVEEVLELLSASLDMDTEQYLHVRMGLEWLIENSDIDVDLVAYTDANADIRYLAYGNDLAAGVQSEMIDSEVHASNMTKQADGEGKKVKKGPAYVPPDIEGCLRAMGWRP